MLAAIASRPTFAEEDWLVVVTADHGGWERSHGQMSTQCYTVPLIVAGRRVPQGRIPGVPHNYDAAPTALAHFGVDVSKIDFDGKVRGGEVAAAPKARALDTYFIGALGLYGMHSISTYALLMRTSPMATPACRYVPGRLGEEWPQAQGPSP